MNQPPEKIREIIRKLGGLAADSNIMAALKLLQEIHEIIPLTEAGMPESFKGTHALTLSMDGELTANIWCEGKCWPITFG